MQTVLITGITDGIGHALALQSARDGVRVLGIGRRALPASLAGAVALEDYGAIDLGEAGAGARVCDFLDARGVAYLDLLVHNAAVGWYGPVAEQSAASIDELLQVNLYAPIALTHALLPRLRAARGMVALISSVHSVLPTSDFAVYTATKAGLDGFARNLRLEERGAIDVIVLWPGPTRTQLHAKSGIPPERIRPARYATPERVATEVLAAVGQRRSRAIGRGNRLLRWMAIHFEPQVDAFMLKVARRRGHP